MKLINEIPEVSSDTLLIEIAKKIVSSAGKLSAKELSDWSHHKDSPWDKTIDSDNTEWNKEIPDSYIKPYFKDFFKITNG